jgi:uncharacterized protein YcaQ
LLAPFDPLVWDRRRFELFWGWDYRFEAYTPPSKRRFGYYALPLLWRDDVIGWANAANVAGTLRVDVGFAKSRPRAPDSSSLRAMPTSPRCARLQLSNRFGDHARMTMSIPCCSWCRR